MPTERIVAYQFLPVADPNGNRRELIVGIVAKIAHVAQVRVNIEATTQQVEVLFDLQATSCKERLLLAIDIDVVSRVVTLRDVAIILSWGEVEREAGQTFCPIGSELPIA